VHETDVAALSRDSTKRRFSRAREEVYSRPDHNIASRVNGEAIPFRDVEIGVNKIERMSVKNLIRGWGGYKI